MTYPWLLLKIPLTKYYVFGWLHKSEVTESWLLWTLDFCHLCKRHAALAVVDSPSLNTFLKLRLDFSIKDVIRIILRKLCSMLQKRSVKITVSQTSLNCDPPSPNKLLHDFRTGDGACPGVGVGSQNPSLAVPGREGRTKLKLSASVTFMRLVTWLIGLWLLGWGLRSH